MSQYQLIQPKLKKLITFFCLLGFSLQLFGQEVVVDSLFHVWHDKAQPDSNRLEAMNTLLGTYHLSNRPDSAIYYSQLQYNLAKDAGMEKYMASALVHQSGAFQKMGNHVNAIERLNSALSLYEGLGNKKGIAKTYLSIGGIYRDQSDSANTVDYTLRSLKIFEEIHDSLHMSRSLNNLGNVFYAMGYYDQAIIYHERGLAIRTKLKDERGISFSLGNLGIVYKSQGDKALAEGNKELAYQKYEMAMENQLKCMDIFKKVNNQHAVCIALFNIGNIHKSKGNYKMAILYGNRSLEMAQQLNLINAIRDASELLYLSYKETGKSRLALEMYELCEQTEDSLTSETNHRGVIRQEYKYAYEKQALADSLNFAKKEAVKDLEIEKQEISISRQRIALTSAAGGLLLIILLAFSIYKGKKKSDELLLNILPEETAKELKQKGYADAKQFDEVTVLFTDFKGFTQISEKLSPTELVSAIDECFKAFDNIIGKYGIEKIKTIGDAYMAAGGLPVPHQVKPEDVVRAALEMRDWMLGYKERKGENGFEIRIGIHTGPVVAGIVGIKKFQYDIWGDTVNTASRMESSGEVSKINISEATYQQVKEKFTCEPRGKIVAKGKGEINMYFVERKEGLHLS